jgi:hypothetical protein
VSEVLESVARIDRAEAAARRADEDRKERDRLIIENARFFQHYDETRAMQLEQGVRWELDLGPMLEPAYGGWREHGAREHRVELSSLAEAPLPPET